MSESITKQFKVIVAHPHTQHSRHSALALFAHGHLECLVTGFVHKQKSALSAVLNLFPANIRRRVQAALSKRKIQALPDEYVQSLGVLELLISSLRKLGFTDQLLAILQRFYKRRFEEKTIRLMSKREPEAVLCFDDSALAVFSAASSKSILRVLDQTTGHLPQGILEYAQEDKRFPEYAQEYPVESPDKLHRATQEVLLADCVLCPSTYVQQTVIASGVSPEKTVVLPYGVDTSKFKPQENRSKHDVFRLIYVGRISTRKGIQYLIEAFDKLGDNNIELLLVGQQVGDFSKLIRHNAKISHRPYMPHGELAALLASCDLFVFPSIHEGSALAVYEALACGLPVITTPNSGSIVEDSLDGYIVPARDSEAIAEKILHLYHSPELLEKMSLAARNKAVEYSWENYQDSLAGVFSELISKKALAS